MTNKLVSVIIPSYNYARYVTEAIDSALAQTYAAREIIVIDDGSKDNTRQVLAPYHDRIRYIYQENQGLPAARNTGILASKGEYIALLDSDDVWHPRKLEAQMRYLADQPDVGLVACGLEPNLSRTWPAVELPDELPVTDITLEQLVICSRFAPSGAVISRRCLDNVGLFDPTLRSVEDREMWLRIATQYPIHKLLLPLCWYRVHNANMSAVAPVMEQFELKVLCDAFETNPRLRGRPLLRQKALSHAAYASALRYSLSGQTWKALGRVVESVLRWPPPYPLSESPTFLARYKSLGLMLLRLAHLRRMPGAVVEEAHVEPAARTEQPAKQSVRSLV
jgi:glycosyltransferase involved in cell wall biosynthesis